MRTPPKTFLDTNILIYAADQADPVKHASAQAVVRRIRLDGNGVISTQVMQEFFVVCVRKLGMTPLSARALTLTLNDFDVVSMTPELVEEAMNLTALHSLSFWDALIIVSAKEAACVQLLSEDLQNGSQIAGVRIENPL